MKSLSFAMTIIAACLAMAFTSPAVAFAQGVAGPLQPEFENRVVEEMKADGFRLSVLRAIPTAVQEGKITRAEGLRLRVAMFSPAFAKQAKELAIIQMAASGSENVPYTESGMVDEAAINWEGLTEFLKVLLPILLELLKGLGAI